MPKHSINPQKTSVAATFYEPAYQRLRAWVGNLHLLGFTSPVNKETRLLLENAGAKISGTSRADCFAEVWEICDEPSATNSDSLIELDRKIAKSLGCYGGRFSAICGEIRWDDCFDEPHRRKHIVSRLLLDGRRPSDRWIR